jgi:hypothetical protein
MPKDLDCRAYKILSEFGLEIVEENKRERYIAAQRRTTGWSWGEKVVIYLEPIGRNQTRVEVISERVLATNITAPDWSNPILGKIEEKLSLSSIQIQIASSPPGALLFMLDQVQISSNMLAKLLRQKPLMA